MCGAQFHNSLDELDIKYNDNDKSQRDVNKTWLKLNKMLCNRDAVMAITVHLHSSGRNKFIRYCCNGHHKFACIPQAIISSHVIAAMAIIIISSLAFLGA